MMNALRDLSSRGASNEEYQVTYPEHIRITDELLVHLNGLLHFFHTAELLAAPICPTDKGKVRYNVGDALAEGYPAGAQYINLMIEGRDGLWRPNFAVLKQGLLVQDSTLF